MARSGRFKRQEFASKYVSDVVPALARFRAPPNGRRLACAGNQLAQWRDIADGLCCFKVIAKTSGEHPAAQRPPGLHARTVIIDAHVQVPTLPLLRVERALAPLEPRIFEKLECREQNGDSADAILLCGSVPIFGRGDKGPHHVGVVTLRTEQMNQRRGQRIDDDRTLRSGVLPDLCGQIKQRSDDADRRN